MRSLDKVRPSEELIRSTIVKIDDHKRRKSRGHIHSITFGTRLVGALCSLALVFCIGFAVARQTHATPDMRTIGQLESTAPAADAHLPTPSSDTKLPNGWILVSGSINNLHFDELTDSDTENHVIRRCKVNITADGLIAKSSSVSVDLNKTEACFDASVLFYSEDAMDSFFDQSTAKMIFCLTPDESGEWIIIDFEPFEN